MKISKDQLLIITISSCVIASVMSTSMLTIAFPNLVDFFNISYSTLQVRNILFFSFFAFLIPLFGKVGDRLGARKLLIFGLSLFIASTILSGTTNNWNLFLLYQTLQAIADAMVVPAQVLLIRQSFKDNKLGWAFGWFSGVLATASLIGPAAGGLVIKYYSWQMIFGVLIIISCISLILVLMVTPKSKKRITANLHLPLKNSLALLVMVISFQFIFNDEISLVERSLSIAVTILSLILFIFYERANHGNTSLLPRKAIKNTIFISSIIRIFVLFTITNVIVLYIPSYMRDIHNIQPDIVGYIIMADSILAVLLSGYAGKLADLKDNRNLLLLSISISIIGMVNLTLTMFNGSLIFFIFAFLLFGLAGVISMPTQNKIAMMSVPEEETGVYMGLFQMVQFGTGAFAAGVFNTLLDYGTDKGDFSQVGFSYVLFICIGLYLVAIGTVIYDKRLLKSNIKLSLKEEV
ncbi:MFS transporter [Peribacillus simplex]|uniref:MFS transporter n=2 Tax=Peribacillus TaxID=2675229 RepID=A0AA90T610_9BACI|nr:MULTISPECIES: MFS transporter [Peribacillus]MDP1418231.1 MFS transporter [Peribacillus simplex]MDP1451107.1 MFS transporter [Peribacillus frigoritolerans]